MVVSDSEEREVKFVRQSSDVMVCIPPKKRHLHWLLSPSTPQSPSLSVTECHQPQQEQCIQQSKSPVSDAAAQEVVSAAALASDYRDEVKKGLSGEKDSVTESLPDIYDQGIANNKDSHLPALEASSGTYQTNSKELDIRDKSLLLTGETELQPTCKELNQVSIVNKFVESTSSNRPTICKIEDNEMKAFNGQDNKTVTVKQEKPDACFTGLGLPEGKLYMQIIPGEANSVQLRTNRSNWDLNTMMDSWEGSTTGSSVNSGEGENQVRLGDMSNNKNENYDNPVSVVPENACSDTQLKLQINPSSGNQSHFNLGVPDHSARLNSSGNLSDLSLSINPITSDGIKVSLTNVIKPEPYADCGQGRMMQLEKFSKTLAVHKAVKREPCEEVAEDATNASLVPDGLKLTSQDPVKPETEGEIFHVNKETTEMKQPCTGLHVGSLNGPQVMKESVSSPSYTQPLLTDCSQSLLNPKQKMSSKDTVPHNTDLHISSSLDSFSKSQCSDGTELDRNLDEGKSSTTSEIAWQATSATQHSDSRVVCNSQDFSENVSSAIIGNSIAGENLHLISDIMDTTAIKPEASEDGCESTVNVHTKMVASDNMGQLGTDVVLDRSVLISSINGSTSELDGPVSVGTDQIDLPENERVVSSSEIDHSAEMPEGKSDTCMDLNGLENASILQENMKPHMGDNDDDIEDGEVRDLQLQHCPIVGSSDDVEAKLTCREEAGAVVDPVGFPLIAASHEFGLETEIEVHKEITSRSSDMTVSPLSDHENTCPSVTVDIQNSADKEVPTTESSKRKLLKTARKISKDILCKEKGLEVKLPSSKSSILGRRTLVEVGIGDAGSLPADYSAPSKPEMPQKLSDIRHVESKASRSRIIHLNSNSRGSSGREKSSERRLVSSSQIERERSCDRSHRGDVSHRRGTRDESCDNGFRKFGKERMKDETSRKAEGEFVRARGRNENQLESLRVDWNSERFNRTNNFRFTRSKNSSEVPSAVGIDCSVESAGRPDLENYTHLSSRRRSPGEREGPMRVGVQMVRRPMRDISPGRHIDGAVSDLVLLNREQKFMQDLPEEMVDASVYSGSHSNFERGNAYIRRGRRSLSPIQRRGHPRLAQMCSPSSIRCPRSPRQWSPQRSPESFDVCHEAIRPTAVRVERMRSPRQHDCFPDDMVGSRRGSPPYRLRDGVRNAGPLRDYEYTRNNRPYQRNIRQIRLIDDQVNSEEYFEPLHPGQLHEMVGDQGLDDERSCNQRHGLVRSLGRQYNTVGDNIGEESFNFRIGREPPRAVRYHPGVEEELRERGDPREGGIRSRLGDLPRRLRDVEDRGNSCQRDGVQGWHDSGFNEVRVKRRRY